uniref:NADH dehydrogenase subunit 4L n=1 Tax=Lepidotrigona terminata TaxID=398115 RepID=A0A6B9N1Y1_9HYME|nr:NADH dehydrogenase subunit 4L [Lepidotrigona terminata]
MKEFNIITLSFTLIFIFMSFNKFYYYLSFLITMELSHIIFLYFLITYKINLWMFFMFLMYSVCEGVLGLLLMISMDNEFGHQKIKFMNLSI